MPDILLIKLQFITNADLPSALRCCQAGSCAIPRPTCLALIDRNLPRRSIKRGVYLALFVLDSNVSISGSIGLNYKVIIIIYTKEGVAL